MAEQRTKKQALAELVREERFTAPVDVSVLDQIPLANIDVGLLPEDQQRQLYDAFHLELRYHPIARELIIRVTVSGESAPILSAAVERIAQGSPDDDSGAEADASAPEVRDVLRAPGVTRNIPNEP